MKIKITSNEENSCGSHLSVVVKNDSNKNIILTTMAYNLYYYYYFYGMYPHLL